MKSLSDPSCLGSIQLKNRLVRSVGKSSNDKFVNQEMIKTYQNICSEGAGLIISEYVLVDEREKNLPVLALYDDSQIEGHKNLVDAVHEKGVKIILQPVSIGSNFIKRRENDPEPFAPSAIINPKTHMPTRKITREEILEVQKKFADAAVRAQKAGYDGIEIYGTRGFLISQFISPIFNRRTDEYGGNIENRSRMLLETLDEIRKAVGKTYPVIVKINVYNDSENDLTEDEIQYLSHKIAEHSATAVEISGNWTRPGKNSDTKTLAEHIADEIAIPIILTGNLCNYDEVQNTLTNSKIGFFGTDRSLVCNSDEGKIFQKEFGY